MAAADAYDIPTYDSDEEQRDVHLGHLATLGIHIDTATNADCNLIIKNI
jgi:hypothetical protein